ncbi:MAG: alpha/beta hydrolase [Pseudomonadota bacterium]
MAETRTERLSSGDTEIVVAVTEGRAPGIMWLSGFRSDMTGDKAVTVAEWGAAHGQQVVRVDYRGHGASGGVFEELVLSDWLADATLAYETFCGAGTILVGSSMGGWLSLCLATRLYQEGTPAGGLVLIAPATDFTERLMWPRLPDTIKQTILREGKALLPSPYGDPYPITKALFEDGRNHLLFGDAPIATGCPIHILQGVQDEDVPHTHALELVERLAQDDVVLTLVKDGDHRLSRPQDIARLIAAVDGMAAHVAQATP